MKTNSPLSTSLSHVNREFQDKQNPVYIYPHEYFIAANGFGYILYDDSSSTIIYDISIKLLQYRQQVTEGIRDNAKVAIALSNQLINYFETSNNGYILKYKDYFILVNDLHDFNKIGDNYHYTGEILESLNTQFVVTSTSSLETALSNNSLNIWLNYATEIGSLIFPAFIAPYNINISYISVEVLDTQSTHLTKFIDNNGQNNIRQNNIDNIRLTLYNSTNEEAQQILFNILELGLTHVDSFGVINTPSWQQNYEDRQNSFGILSNKKTMELSINYNLITGTNMILHIFKEILATINEFEIQLYKEQP